MKEEHGKRRYPIGAEVQDGRIDFRVWANSNSGVKLLIESPFSKTIEMEREEGGYFSASIEQPEGEVLYRFHPAGAQNPLADPASRFQPQGPSGPSQVIDPSRFAWSDGDWKGITSPNQILYEMHTGTFTPEGTWRAATRQLEALAKAGITVLELMPIGDFNGTFGWGYDGICLFAPTRLYGTPEEARTFVNEAHRLGMGVILDIVYNHLGPGNFMAAYSKTYLSERTGEWGKCFNFDGPGCRPVREFFLTNVRYWIEEFHFDGFRIDATQGLIDDSPVHLIKDIVDSARAAAPGRTLFITGENEPQQRKLLDEYGLDALWNDDFHHTMRVAMTGRNDAYYSDYTGSAREVASTATHGFLYQGQYSRWQRKRRGSVTQGLARSRFICYTENHDQVANSAFGRRMHQQVSPAMCRCAAALLLLGPWTPLIFQGQEFNASSPFLYFADVSFPIDEHRRGFLSQFPTIRTAAISRLMAHPADPETFRRSRLNPEERDNPFAVMFRDAAWLRRKDAVFSSPDECEVEQAVFNEQAFVLRLVKGAQGRLLIVNFGRSILVAPAAEPLLAPHPKTAWEVMFHTEAPAYGGGGLADVETVEGWHVPAQCAVVLRSV